MDLVLHGPSLSCAQQAFFAGPSSAGVLPPLWPFTERGPWTVRNGDRLDRRRSKPKSESFSLSDCKQGGCDSILCKPGLWQVLKNVAGAAFVRPPSDASGT